MLQHNIDYLKNKYIRKKILVVGLGLQGGGVGIARFFAELGARVIVTDKKTEKQLISSINSIKNYSITFHLGDPQIQDFLEADLIFKGPSVLWDTPEIKAALDKNIPVEMELSFVASHTKANIIGITGTRGKSTTTNLIYEVLKQSGFSVFLGGGLPGISTINYLKTSTEKDYLVMELSSWALSGFHKKKISPHIAVFTNLYPDHLNYYKNIEDYFYDKAAIFAYQTKDDNLIINKDLEARYSFFDRHTPMGPLPIVSKKISSPQGHNKIEYFSKNNFPYKLNNLKGDHNLENAAAALTVSKILGIDEKKAISIISNYKGLSYRQELIGKKNNVIFINDTTSTTPIATVKAIETFSDKPIYLILGGNSKNLPSEILVKYLTVIKKIILLDGSFTKEILPLIKNKLKDKLVGPFSDLNKAINQAYNLAKKEEKETYLLFSPGATSFAMFNNEFHRGEEFNRIVKEIIK